MDSKRLAAPISASDRLDCPQATGRERLLMTESWWRRASASRMRNVKSRGWAVWRLPEVSKGSCGSKAPRCRPRQRSSAISYVAPLPDVINFADEGLLAARTRRTSRGVSNGGFMSPPTLVWKITTAATRLEPPSKSKAETHCRPSLSCAVSPTRPRGSCFDYRGSSQTRP